MEEFVGEGGTLGENPSLDLVLPVSKITTV